MKWEILTRKKELQNNIRMQGRKEKMARYLKYALGISFRFPFHVIALAGTRRKPINSFLFVVTARLATPSCYEYQQSWK